MRGRAVPRVVVALPDEHELSAEKLSYFKLGNPKFLVAGKP